MDVFSHSKEAKVFNLKYLTMALIASDVMLNHLPPLHDQKHIRSSVCRHHRHHGALPNAHEDHEDLGSSVSSSW